jgi:hypothetical protein
MGIYTNHSNYYASSDYRDVEPFHGEHFNYHELGIIAAVESAHNRDEFMKAIALSELASVEQYGTDQVFYESVSISGIFEKIKAFFKKIIEKIHKIFHTFIAKMSSWFGSNKSFAQKYEKEIIKNWGLVKSDWEFKGYKFSNLPGKDSNFTATYETAKNVLRAVQIDGNNNTKVKIINNLIDAKSGDALSNALNTIGTNSLTISRTDKDDDADTQAARSTAKDALDAARDHMDEWKDKVRGCIADSIAKRNGITSINMESQTQAKPLDSKEFTEELFKLFRSGEDSKEDINLSKLGSASEVLTFIKDYDKIKDQTEKLEQAMVKSIDELIKAISKAQDDLIKENKADTNPKSSKKLDNELIVQASSYYQSCWGFVKEAQTQAFSAMLQALKDCCAQNKEVCVKIIGLNKKMTESADYYNDGYTTSTAFGGDFISSVKLV